MSATDEAQPGLRGVAARIVREAVRIDPSGVQFRFGLRSTAGVAIVLFAALASGHAKDGIPAALGAFITAFASRQGVYRTRAAAMLFVAAATGLSAFVASTTGGNTFLSIVLAIVWGLAAGIFASLGPVATTVGINALVALALFGQFHDSPLAAAQLALIVFAGGVFQTLLLVVVWPLAGFSAERKVLAGAYRALGRYAADSSSSMRTTPSIDAFTTLTATLADPQPFARRGEIAAFELLLVEAERIRTTLVALATDRYTLERAGNDSAAQAVAEFVAATRPIVNRIAEALEAGSSPHDWDDSWESLEGREERLERQGRAQSTEDARALVGQLRAAWQAAAFPANTVSPSDVHFEAMPLPSRLAEAARTLRANCTPASNFAQHGVRLAVTLGIATWLAHVLPLQRPYWITLTAAIVLRPDFATTFTRGVARLIGTLAGALVAGALVAVLHPGGIADLLLALAFAAVGYTIFNLNYAIFTMAITGWVVFLLAFGGLPEQSALADRIVASLIGGTLALAAYAFWPSWEREVVPVRLGELLEAQRAYCALVLAALIDPAHKDLEAIHAAQLTTWRARSNAEASVDRMLNEPVAPTALTVRAALGLLAASRRFGLATLTLLARLDNPAATPVPTLRPLADALDQSLGEIAQALRARIAPAALPPLRDLQLAFADHASPDERSDALVGETDLMVDSANSMADVLRRLRENEPVDGRRAQGPARR
jgi:uncharacterized membrane protein YccC